MLLPSARSTVTYRTSRRHEPESHHSDKHYSEDIVSYIMMNVFIFGTQTLLYNLVIIKWLLKLYISSFTCSLFVVGIILFHLLVPIDRNKWTQLTPCCHCRLVRHHTPFLTGILVLLAGELTSSSFWFTQNIWQYTFCTSTSWFNLSAFGVERLIRCVACCNIQIRSDAACASANYRHSCFSVAVAFSL